MANHKLIPNNNINNIQLINSVILSLKYHIPYSYGIINDEPNDSISEINPILVGPYRYCIDAGLKNSKLDELKVWCNNTYSSKNKIKEFFGILRYKISYCHNRYIFNIENDFRNNIHIMFRTYDDAVMFKLAWYNE